MADNSTLETFHNDMEEALARTTMSPEMAAKVAAREEQKNAIWQKALVAWDEQAGRLDGLVASAVNYYRYGIDGDASAGYRAGAIATYQYALVASANAMGIPLDGKTPYVVSGWPKKWPVEVEIVPQWLDEWDKTYAFVPLHLRTNREGWMKDKAICWLAQRL